MIDYTGWSREYLENKEEYLKLFDNIMQKEQEKNVEFLEKSILESLYGVTDRKYAVAVGSGTDALHFALISLGIKDGIGIKPGDEVLTTNFSWISTASCITMVGATPVFCDIDPDTYHMSLESIKKMWSPKVKAIIYPHLFGSMSETFEILEFCIYNNIAFIEDACQSLGSSFNGIKAGTIGDVSAISFNANKPVAGIAGGGAFLTDNKEQANLVRKLRRHGNNEVLGYNSKMLLFNAEFINFRLKKMEQWQDRRLVVAVRYDDNLNQLPVIIQPRTNGLNHNYHKYVIRLKDKKTRDLLKERLKADVHYSKPISENEMYKSIIHRKDNCVNCKKVTETILSLPIHPYVTDEEVDNICDIIMMTV
jgi:dTDP-4-amino-4,6-dideoxygalactose transaminase|tara:strand:- start:279 stop:1373 length:1095 start_codon:yes stop_codon:yes gene_type:complete